MPPSRAIVTAIGASVTVSMLALINGMFREMFLESCVDRSVWERLDTSENLGTRRTSSNVNPSRISKRTSYSRKKTVISLSCPRTSFELPGLLPLFQSHYVYELCLPHLKHKPPQLLMSLQVYLVDYPFSKFSL